MAGVEYSVTVRNRRVRIATALPALIGARTIALLRESGEDALQRKVKVPRDEVRRMVRRVVLSVGSKKVICELFRRNVGHRGEAG
jgi:farnesyl-diphosphate farnesyltransferase